MISFVERLTERWKRPKDEIRPADFGVNIRSIPLDAAESRVFVTRHMPDGRRRVLKIYDTPFALEVIDLGTLVKYQDLTTQAGKALARRTDKLMFWGETTPVEWRVVEIERIGYLSDSKHGIVCGISEFIEGDTLSDIVYKPDQRIFDKPEVEVLLASVSEDLNAELRTRSINLSSWNIKTDVTQNRVTLRVTDLCEWVSMVSGREPNFAAARKIYGNMF